MSEGTEHPHFQEEMGSTDLQEEYWDNISGASLRPDLVKKAREEELKFVDSRPLCDDAPLSECHRVTGRKPISTRWVDVDKGDAEYRSRWVARDYKAFATDEYFVATPPVGGSEAFDVPACFAGSGASGRAEEEAGRGIA